MIFPLFQAHAPLLGQHFRRAAVSGRATGTLLFIDLFFVF
jgi:hypothetical protein